MTMMMQVTPPCSVLPPQPLLYLRFLLVFSAGVAAEAAAAATADLGDPEPSHLENDNNYVGGEEFFKLLQDHGVEFSEEEKADFEANPKKTRAKHIRHGDRLYPGIWQLAKQYHKDVLFANKEAIVPKLPSNPTNVVRDIGQFILSNRHTISKADIHSVTNVDASQKEYAIHSSEYESAVRVSFFAQRELLSHCIGKWGATEDDLKVPTDDDKLRIICLLFTEAMREKIELIVANKDPTNRLDLDAWKGQQRALWRRR